jgi:hypothetical protein
VSWVSEIVWTERGNWARGQRMGLLERRPAHSVARLSHASALGREKKAEVD